MAIFLDQVALVFRRLGRAPLFTAITLLTLAIGVGANTVIFSVVEGVLLKPLPYPHSEQLIGVWHTAPGIGLKEVNMSPSIYFIDAIWCRLRLLYVRIHDDSLRLPDSQAAWLP